MILLYANDCIMVTKTLVQGVEYCGFLTPWPAFSHCQNIGLMFSRNRHHDFYVSYVPIHVAEHNLSNEREGSSGLYSG